MAQDKVTLFNLAISHTGNRGAKVSSPDENSQEGEECRQWFEPARNAILRGAFWPATKAFKRLAVLKERTNDGTAWVTGDPEPGFRFVYSAPNDMLYPRYLSTFERFSMGIYDTESGEIKAVHTSAEEAILVYSKVQDNIELWDESLFMGVAAALGFYISIPLHGKLSFMQAAREQANLLILQAREQMSNEDEAKIEALAPWFQARGYEGYPVQDKYMYPYGPLLGEHPGGLNVR